MRGERRRAEQVVARPVIRAIAIGVALIGLGHMILLGCAWAWARQVDQPDRGLILIAAAGFLTFAGGVTAMVAAGFAR